MPWTQRGPLASQCLLWGFCRSVVIPRTHPASQPSAGLGWRGQGMCGMFLPLAHSCWSGRVLCSGSPFLLKEDRGCSGCLPLPPPRPHWPGESSGH